ncbi:MAG: type II toxin-antitoxin system Phd/YefM family antitoxin, partial [Actinomycetota bacterium]|nr:type II toxin-antitoxin system Phd/YefM family antitoxin [Actinomycetota bacterium]
AYGGERIVLTRHGRPFVALISAEDLSLLDEPRSVTGTATPGEMSSSPEQSNPTSIAATYTPPTGPS